MHCFHSIQLSKQTSQCFLVVNGQVYTSTPRLGSLFVFDGCYMVVGQYSQHLAAALQQFGMSCIFIERPETAFLEVVTDCCLQHLTLQEVLHWPIRCGVLQLTALTSK